jgi:hypothetical protein
MDLGENKTVFITGRNASTAGGIDIKGEFKCLKCTIILTNKDMSATARIGQVTMNGNAIWRVTAPTDPTHKYRGIAMMQDRRATNIDGNKFNGGGDATVTGAIYFPNQGLDYTGNSTTTGICLRMFARRVTFGGTTGINIASTAECAGRGVGFDAPEGGSRIRLTA